MKGDIIMLDTAKRFNQECKEVIDLYAKQMTSADMLNSMTPETLTLLQRSFGLLNASMEYIELQAKTMDEINNKLDRLLASK